jgi:flagellar hook-basal body complex protein FliE
LDKFYNNPWFQWISVAILGIIRIIPLFKTRGVKMEKKTASKAAFLNEQINQYKHLLRSTSTLKEKFINNKQIRIENMLMDCSENQVAFQHCINMMDSILVDLPEKIKLYEKKLSEL